MNIELGQIVTQIIGFLILLAVLKRFAWGPLLKLMDDRRERILHDFATIERREIELHVLEKSYNEKLENIDSLAKKLGKEEVAKGRAQAKEIEEEAQQHSREIIKRAQIMAQEEFMRAKVGLKKTIIKLTMAATEAILKKNLDKEKQQELISEYLEEAKFK